VHGVKATNFGAEYWTPQYRRVAGVECTTLIHAVDHYRRPRPRVAPSRYASTVLDTGLALGIRMDDPNQLLAGRTRETTIARDAEGRWSQDGQALEHPKLTRAFDRWVGRADDGRYCLKNDINWAYISLEGAPFFVRSVRIAPASGKAGVTLVLSNDTEQPLRPPTLRSGQDGALYCDLNDGMVARFDRSAMAQLESLIGEDEQGVYLEIGGSRIRPKASANPLQPV
jgi:uncharacterized protein